jgi:hypothetical protein
VRFATGRLDEASNLMKERLQIGPDNLWAPALA